MLLPFAVLVVAIVLCGVFSDAVVAVINMAVGTVM